MLAQIFSRKIKQKNKRNPLLCDKVLITTLGTVSFMKTLYVSKEKNEDGKFEM